MRDFLMGLAAVFGSAALVLGGATGCVTTKQYDSMRAQAMKAERQAESAKTTIAELEAERNRLQASLDGLSGDRARLQSMLDSLAAAKSRLEGDNASLRNDYTALLDGASAQAARMLAQLDDNQRELDARLARMRELEAALKARNAALESIRAKVADALLGFAGRGLSVARRDGKVYVSMEDKLLFTSGSYEIDPNGAAAVRDLAAVLAANTDIDIVVEGHTDTVPYRAAQGAQLIDNLDLSVKRATTVTRLLLENRGIAPARITSAGRGEWLPIDRSNSEVARTSNRRTEIILTPKLDELLKITQ